MSLKKVIQAVIKESATSKLGTIVSTPTQLYADGSNWIWAADVALADGTIMRKVPISFNNRDISYSEIGKPIQLGKMVNGVWCINGLSKTVTDTTHTIYLTASDNVVAVQSQVFGKAIRRLTYAELGEALNGSGYGLLPYGSWGRFDSAGNLAEILEM